MGLLPNAGVALLYRSLAGLALAHRFAFFSFLLSFFLSTPLWRRVSHRLITGLKQDEEKTI